MQNVDFEEVRDFEPPRIAPFVPRQINFEPGEDDQMLKMSAHLQRLDELTLMLDRVIEPDSRDQGGRKNQLREYTRVPVSESGSAADFHVLGCRYRCQLVEMSLGGFGIFIPRLLSIHPGTLGRLHGEGLSYIVSVSRIVPRNGGIFIGLKQVEEVLNDEPFRLHPGPTSLGYLIAGIAGMLIATMGYLFLQGH